MAGLWQRVLRTFKGDPRVADPLPGYPRTYEDRVAPSRPEAAALERPQVFDPALKQFRNGFRRGDPVFAGNADLERRWRSARRHATDHVVRLIAGSPAAEHLVFRGSLVLHAWLGPELARDPGDIDCVVTPSSYRMTDQASIRLMQGIVELVRSQPQSGDSVAFSTDTIATDEIWTYDRAPGRRIVFPWQPARPDDADVPGGVVQLDLVFCEDLPVPPVVTPIPHADGPPSQLRTATRELSLAWKLLWLETDSNPQAKDLYDAVLLADNAHPLSPDLLRRVFEPSAGTPVQRRLNPDSPYAWKFDDWDEFRREYPQVTGTAADWQRRLAAAIASGFGPS